MSDFHTSLDAADARVTFPSVEVLAEAMHDTDPTHGCLTWHDCQTESQWLAWAKAAVAAVPRLVEIAAGRAEHHAAAAKARRPEPEL